MQRRGVKMATPLKIMVWNVRDMGIYVKSVNNEQENFICCFIGSLISTYGIDVVIIQELKANGANMLSKITTTVNENLKDKNDFYDVDFVSTNIPSSVPSFTTKHGSSKRYAESLKLFSKVQFEGYGVIARHKYILPVQVERSLSFCGIIELCEKASGVVGANPEYDVPFSICTPPKTSGFKNDINFVSPDSQDLDSIYGYCLRKQEKEKEKEKVKPDRNVLFAKTAQGATKFESRRPCKISIVVENIPIDLLTYHGISKKSDSNNKKAFYGANLTTLLYEVKNSTNVMLAGDFNLINDSDIGIAFQSLTSDKLYTAQTLSKGKYLGSKNFFKDGQYIGSPLDLMFTKFNTSSGISKNQGSVVWDLPSLLWPGTPSHKNDKYMPEFTAAILSSESLTTFVAIVFAGIQSKDEEYKSFGEFVKQAGAPVGSNLEKLFSKNSSVATFDQLTAALFYLMFISDHLPLMISLEVGDE